MQAAAAHEAIRINIINELETADEGGGRPKTRSTQSLQAIARRTRKQREAETGSQEAASVPETQPEAQPVLGIEVPSDDTPMTTTSSSGEERSEASAPARDDDAASAPSLFDNVEEEPGALLGDLDAPADAPEPEPEPAPEPAPAQPEAAEPAHPKDPYFREVFEAFFETKINCGESVDNFTFEKFARKLRKNTDDLMARAGVTDVTFSVYVKDGKAAIKAKVVKG